MATSLNAFASNVCGTSNLLRSVDGRGMQFLDVLIECEQKDVVSQPAVQKHLSDVWRGRLDWPDWKMVLVFMAMLFIPPTWVVFSLAAKHPLNRVPVIKFMSYLVSHIYLMGLYVLTIVYPTKPIYKYENDLMPQWYEWLLLCWLSGLLVSQLTNPQDRAGLGWIKVVVIAISAMGVFIHLVAFLFEGNDRLHCIYVRNQFFAFSLMLLFVGFFEFLSFHHLFGPWAIIIQNLLKDLTRFLVLLCIVLFGFTLFLAAAYRPIYEETQNDVTRTETPIDTFEIVFFAVFGLVEPPDLPRVHHSRHPSWAMALIKIVFGMYLIVTVIVLLNLLIAMMSDTYQRIQAQSDTEWKFGRAKLYRNMAKTSATPAPLNLITKLIVYSRILCKHGGNSKPHVHKSLRIQRVVSCLS